MARYTVRPYDDCESWGDYDDIKEAFANRSRLAMSFFSRAVIVYDNVNNCEVDSLPKEHKDDTTNVVDNVVPLVGMGVNSDIDYEDIYDDIDDYEYPYNHINREGV